MLARLLFACCVAVQEPPAPPTPAAPAAPAPERVEQAFLYAFDKERDLDDFEILHGAWSVSTGTLWCTSKGAREELRWRRKLTPKGRVTAKVVGAANTALALTGGGREVVVHLDRSSNRITVETDARVLLERTFDAPATGPLVLSLRFDLADLALRVGDDEELRVTIPDQHSPFEQLALLSFKSQPRFDELTVGRDAAATTPTAGEAEAGAAALSEDQRLALEHATRLLEAGDAGASFELVTKSLGGGGKSQPGALAPTPLLVLLQRIALRDERLRGKEPIATLIAGRTLAARDDSATLVLPFAPAWRAEVPEIRRVDGPVFELTCSAPELRVQLYRYDQKLKYWFGRDPRIVYSSGGGGPTLARARADDQKDAHAKATFTRELDRSKQSLGGEQVYDYEITWPDAQAGGPTHSLHEWFVLHRGDTWRVSVEGTPLTFELAQDDITWILAGLRFTKN